MPFTIRIANITDSQAITDLSNQLGYQSSSSDIKKRLTEVLAHPENKVFVATDNKKIVGWVHGFYTIRVESDPCVEIGGLVVDENSRSQGIGKTLVEKVNEWAKSVNCTKIRVRCNAIRTESHIFYEKTGFILNKQQKVFDRQIH